jgi:DNA-binding FrmR family transcriptional regulator
MHEPTASTASREDTEAILTRLRRIEGQIRGIHRMLEEDRVCEDVVTQLMAARSSLDQVGLRIIDHHIDRCLMSSDSEEALRNLRQALRMWLRFGGPTQPSDQTTLGR